MNLARKYKNGIYLNGILICLKIKKKLFLAITVPAAEVVINKLQPLESICYSLASNSVATAQLKATTK